MKTSGTGVYAVVWAMPYEGMYVERMGTKDEAYALYDEKVATGVECLLVEIWEDST
jgi:hypothetical protein